MRIVVTGATGNVGTRVLEALLARGDAKHQITGIARRLPEWRPQGVRWVSADVGRDQLEPHFEGADAVIHLAWLIQPGRDRAMTDQANVEGSRRVFAAAADAGVPALIYSSSVAAYSPPNDVNDPVDEDWPIGGIPGAYYSEQKVAVEHLLDDVEQRHPEMRIVRARPGLIFQRRAATEIRRYFGGPLLPGKLARPSLLPIIPALPGLAGQLVHSEDVGEFYALATENADARGAYNVATAPPLDPAALAHLLSAKPVPLPSAPVRALVTLTHRARLHPVSAGWLDIALGVPVMTTARATEELGWQPRYESGEVLLELLAGMREGAGFPTPPLDPRTGGPLRIRELLGTTERVRARRPN